MDPLAGGLALDMDASEAGAPAPAAVKAGQAGTGPSELDKENQHSNTGTPLRHTPSRLALRLKLRSPRLKSPRQPLRPMGAVPTALVHAGVAGRDCQQRAKSVYSEQSKPHTLLAHDVVAICVDGEVLHAKSNGSAGVVELEAAGQPTKATLSLPGCQVSVVRCDEFVGFRSLVSGKLLQGKRKGRNRFCFFSDKFGVAEQWVVEPEPAGEWATAEVVLRNRRVETIQLRCQLVRVPEELLGRREPDPATTAAGALSSGQSHAGETDVGSADASLPATMTNVMISQWGTFISKEVAARKELEEQMRELLREMHGIREDTCQEIQLLRSEAAYSVQEALEASSANFVELMTRRSAYWTLRRAFASWRATVEDSRSTRADELRQLSRAARHATRSELHKALEGWRSAASTSIADRMLLEDAGAFRRARLAGYALMIWQAFASRSLHIKQLLGKRLRLLASRRTREAFLAWRAEAELTLDPTHLLAHFTLGGTACQQTCALSLADLVVRHMRLTAGIRTVHRAFVVWFSTVHTTRVINDFRAWRDISMLYQAFNDWHNQAWEASRATRVSARLQAKRQGRVLAAVLAAWWQTAAQQATARLSLQVASVRFVRRLLQQWSLEAAQASTIRSVLMQRIWKMSNALMQTALEDWSAVTAERVRERLRAEVRAQNLVIRGNTAVLRAVVFAWACAAYVGPGVATCQATVHRFQRQQGRRMLWLRMMAWRQVLQQSQERVAVLESLVAQQLAHKSLQSTMSALSFWKHWAREQCSSRDMLLKMAVTEWRIYTDHRLATEAAVETARVSLWTRAASCILAAWFKVARGHTSTNSVIRHFQANSGKRLIRSCFMAWSDEASGQGLSVSEAVAMAHMRMVCTRTKRRVLFTWCVLVLTKIATVQCFQDMMPPFRAFKAWRATVKYLRHLKTCETAIGSCRATTIYTNVMLAWREFAGEQHRYKAHAVSSWRAWAICNKRESERSAIFKAFEARQLLGRSLLAWKDTVACTAAERHLAALYMSHFCQRTLLRAVRGWKRRTVMKLLSTQFMGHNQSRVMMACLVSWAKTVSEALEFRQVCAATAAQRHRVLAAGAFMVFRLYAAKSQVKAARRKRARLILARKLVQRFLSSWREVAVRKQTDVIGFSSLIEWRSVARAFAAWTAFTCKAGSVSDAASALFMRRQLSCCRWAMHQWRMVATQHQTMVSIFLCWNRRRASQAFILWAHRAAASSLLRRRVVRLMTRRSQGTESSCLLAWSNLVEDRRCLQRAVTKNRHALETRLAASKLRQWRENAQVLKVLRAVALRRISSRRSGVKMVTLTKWREAVALSISTRSLIAKACRASASRCLTRIWLVWASMASSAVAARRAASCLFFSIQRRRLQDFLCAWQSEAAQSRRRRALCSRHATRRLIAVLMAWRSITTVATLVHSAALLVTTSNRRQALRGAWTLWASSVAQQATVARLAESRMLSKLRQAVMARCFLWWSTSVGNLADGRAAAGRLGALRRALVLSSAWSTWMCYTREMLNRRDKLRRCVGAKRIARDSFLGWYSSAFEEEINQAVKMLYSSCEDSLELVFKPIKSAALTRNKCVNIKPQNAEGQIIPAVGAAHVTSNAVLRIPRSMRMDLEGSVAGSFLGDSAPSTPSEAFFGGSGPSSLQSAAAKSKGPAGVRHVAEEGVGNPLFCGAGVPQPLGPAWDSPPSPVEHTPHPTYQPASALRPGLSTRRDLRSDMRTPGPSPSRWLPKTPTTATGRLCSLLDSPGYWARGSAGTSLSFDEGKAMPQCFKSAQSQPRAATSSKAQWMR